MEKKLSAMQEAANKYLEELRISSASIDQRRDMDRRKGFIAGWKKSEQITSAPLLKRIEEVENCKVCVGCGHIYGDDLAENKSCCPDSKYLPLKEFVDNWLCEIINIKTENANLVRYDYNHVIQLQKRISELEGEIKALHNQDR